MNAICSLSLSLPIYMRTLCDSDNIKISSTGPYRRLRRILSPHQNSSEHRQKRMTFKAHLAHSIFDGRTFIRGHGFVYTIILKLTFCHIGKIQVIIFLLLNATNNFNAAQMERNGQSEGNK